ncbi:unnamed protein product [Rotaria sordida]|uniref:DUF4200 domain-containing protein n=1 Tax=Rotaria sordida TaxID=392033 RepID=A0A815DKL2_9BILA|nr:unnamed protein product [Rotaria sordida]CAF1242923.1 unnamed protein product [Rotaria sordida]CAF1299512.1 unnamed protein product [Rotaria sordida]CAF3706878.1 unnamed protein product [Rotaria sordida]CAF3912714.1 unnamed protein product [Rotaria sordida]
MSSVIDSDTLGAEKMGPGSAKQGLGSRATSKVTFRDGEGKSKTQSSAHPSEGEHRSSSVPPNLQLQYQQQQFGDLKKKDTLNPFKFSPDVDFCALSQLDKHEKAQERERMQTLKVHEKLSKAQRLMKGRRFRVLKEIDDEIEQERAQNKENRVASMRDNAPWLVAITRNRRVENESLQDFIGKKRNMFVLQYELTVKRTEMRKLEEITAAEEQRIEKAEKDLEEDAHMFDQFLAANNKNANEAARLADEEARKKLEKVAEIKRLHGQITALKSELVRREDELNELKQYKQFLDQITPSEWKDERRKKLEQERLLRQKLDVQSAVSDDSASKAGSRPQSRVVDPKTGKRGGPLTQKGFTNVGGSRRRSSTSSHDVELAVRQGSEMDIHKISPSEMNINDLDNDFELYFTDPQQLLAIFTELEEQNLSLIQNSQDHEEQLEEITRELQITMRKKNLETESLQRQVNHLEQAIELEEQKEKELMAKVGAHSLFNEDGKQDEYLAQLSAVISDVYKKIFNENPVTSDPLKNLASIENRLEELFQELQLMDPLRLQEAEKGKEKERRIRLREQKKLEEERAAEEKKRKAALRAKEPPKKHVGRPIAERSRPPELKKTDQDTINKTNEEEEELAYYFT